MKKGAISIMTILSIAGATATALMGMISYVNIAIAPVQAKIDSVQQQTASLNENIGEVNVKLDFILGKYGARYTAGNGIVTSTWQNLSK